VGPDGFKRLPYGTTEPTDTTILPPSLPTPNLPSTGFSYSQQANLLPLTTAEPTYQPTTSSQTNSIKQISDIAKMYTDKQKYNSVNHSFDYKLAIFLNICRRNDLPENLLSKAFPIMLKGIALDHYYNNMLSQCSY
jgi:hypothetical protein